MAWPWRDSVLVRVMGAFVSWAGFVTCFTLLFLVSYALMALGGSCASGGPYVIEVECPANVALFAPLSIVGGFLFAGIALLFAQGFGTPLVVWAWPILFVGLSVPFFVSGTTGDVSGWIVGAVFLLMGVAPLLLLLRGTDRWTLFLGSRSAAGRQFVTASDRPVFRLINRRPGAQTDLVRPTAGDWLLSLGVVTLAVMAGIFAARLLWAATG